MPYRSTYRRNIVSIPFRAPHLALYPFLTSFYRFQNPELCWNIRLNSSQERFSIHINRIRSSQDKQFILRSDLCTNVNVYWFLSDLFGARCVYASVWEYSLKCVNSSHNLAVSFKNKKQSYVIDINKNQLQSAETHPLFYITIGTTSRTGEKWKVHWWTPSSHCPSRPRQTASLSLYTGNDREDFECYCYVVGLHDRWNNWGGG